METLFVAISGIFQIMMIMGVQISHQYLFSLPLNTHSDVDLLDHMVVLFLICYGIPTPFSIVAAKIYILQSTTFPPTLTSCLLDDCYSNRCEVVSHSGIDLHFPYD